MGYHPLWEVTAIFRGLNPSFKVKQKEATMGFEPMIRVLQTLALPLGHVALL